MLQAKLADIAEKDDRTWLLTLLKFYFMLLEMTQKQPILHRLKFFDCVYIVFSFLQLNGQLRRHKERFDKECAADLCIMFVRLYDGL